MKPYVSTLACMMLLAGCGGDGGSARGGTPAPASAVPTPAPTPSPTPTPAPAPTPTPTPALSPSPTPTATPATYNRFADIYIYRFGAGITVQSACTGLAFSAQPPAVLPVTGFGQGYTFRHIITPQVWALGGDISIGFDGRDGDTTPSPLGDSLDGTLEIGLSKQVGPDRVRFWIARPIASGSDLEYVRLATVAGPVAGVPRLYQCVTGMPTLAADLATAASASYPRAVLKAIAFVREGAGSRAYALDRSTLSIVADLPAGQVRITMQLVGTPLEGGGPTLDLGTMGAIAAIDAASGDVAAELAGADGTVAGALRGRFFGPQALEIAMALGGTVAADAGRPTYSFAGGVFAIR